MLAGVNISIPNFHADLVLVSVFESRTSAFAIDVKHIFEANAQIAAHAGLGLSLLIGMGVIIPPINFKKTVSINDKPSIEANMTYTASKICTGLSEDDSYAKGVKYRLDCEHNNLALVTRVRGYADMHTSSFEQRLRRPFRHRGVRPLIKLPLQPLTAAYSTINPGRTYLAS